MLARHDRARPLSKGPVKSPTSATGRRRRHRDPRAQVATDTEALLPVATRASIGRHPRFDRVKREIVVRMRATVSHPAVVTLDALTFAMTNHATLGIARSNYSMRNPKVRVVMHPVHPLRWVEPPLGKARSKHSIRFGPVTARTPGARTPRLMTTYTLAHRR
jgi:hypothetical protein